MITVILIVLITTWIFVESVVLHTQKLHHYIKRNGADMLHKELEGASLNHINTKIILINGTSELSGVFITDTCASIIFPYYLYDTNRNSYGILIFSKAYWIVRAKYKELKKGGKPKHINFSKP